MKELPIGTTGIAARDIDSIADHIPKGARIITVETIGWGYAVKAVNPNEDGATGGVIHEVGGYFIIPDDNQ